MRNVLRVVLSCSLSALLVTSPLCAIAEELAPSLEGVEAPQASVSEEEPPSSEESLSVSEGQEEPSDVPENTQAEDFETDQTGEDVEQEVSEDLADEGDLSESVDDPVAVVEEDAAADEAATPEAPDSLEAMAETNGKVSVRYSAHVQNIGWQKEVKDGALAGTSGRSLRMEALKVSVALPSGVAGGVEYRSQVQNDGWLKWVRDGALCGTSGRSLRVEAFQMRLYGDAALQFDIYYRVHVQNIGWMGWAKNGELSGTTGKSLRMEAVQVVVVPKGSGSPNLSGSNVSEAFRDGAALSVQSHVQNVGWQASVGSGSISGTTGRSLRVEAFRVNLGGAKAPGGIRYCSHVQNVGWQGWVSGGSISGTTGRSLRVEAIRAELTGELAEYYDLYYRVHVQDIGWLAWAKNGEAAGTAGRSARIEAFQFKLVSKGSAAPSNSGAATEMRFLVGVSYGFEGLKTYVLSASSYEGAGDASALSFRFAWKRQGESAEHVLSDWSDVRTAKLTVDDIGAKEGTYLLIVEQRDLSGKTYSTTKKVSYKPSVGTFQDLLDAAAKDIGYYEGNDPQTGTKFGRWYEAKVDKNKRNYDFGEDGVAYCVMAVSYWMDLAKVYGPGLPRAGCEGVYFAALADGRTVSPTNLQPGMLVLFDWDGDKLPDHIGIVEKRINATTYQTIEGNTSRGIAGSQDNGGWVARRTRTVAGGILCGVVPYYT